MAAAVNTHLADCRLRRQKVAFAALAGSMVGLALIVDHWVRVGWDIRAIELAAGTAALPDKVRQSFNTPLGWAGPVAGLLLLSLGGFLGQLVFAGRQAKNVAHAAAWTLVLLAPLHLLEGQLVTWGSTESHVGWAQSWLQGAAFLGFALLPPAGIVALLGTVTTGARMYASHKFGKPEVHPGVPAVRPDPDNPGDDAHWCVSNSLPKIRRDRDAGARDTRLGICLSGGGIRSATFSVGVLQALQQRYRAGGDPAGCSELSRARYLAAVSGGAYTAGAYLLAQQPGKNKDGKSVKPPPVDEVFAAGSPEFDRLRQHSAYIADGLREWAMAILIFVRGALLSMMLLALLTMTAGRWAGHAYYAAGFRLGRSVQAEWGATAGAVAVAGLALGLWLLSLLPLHGPAVWRERLRNGARAATIALAMVVFLGAGVPLIAGLSAQILGLDQSIAASVGQASGQRPLDPADVARGGVIGVLGVLLTIGGLLYRRSAEVAKAAQTVAKQTTKFREQLGDTGRRMVQWLAVYLGLTMVLGVYLILFGYWAHTMAAIDPGRKVHVIWGHPHWWFPHPIDTNLSLTVALTVVLCLIYAVVDETTIGLHPFYRHRLARAFAVRRGVRTDDPADDEDDPYDRDTETKLETYGKPQDGRAFPQVIFCAAAHCSDPDRTPPGRHVLPWTFSHDAVGGPELGWYSTKCARDGYVPPRLAKDMTVLSAMAVSGAAFASASGKFRGPANLLLALTNARLGLWLPNPRIFNCSDRDKWWFARPPRIRRMSYLIREIFNWNPRANPLLFVSDGAGYDNLGLVELLRHRCREIYCFDASSDDAAFAHSLAASITLAADELGVTIDVPNADLARPQPAEDGDKSDLTGRLAKLPVITGTIAYPALPMDGLRDKEPGVLVIGRAELDPDTPWEVKRHAAAHPTFPHDVAGDQWFDDEKFNAYTTLGRHVGSRAVQEMTRLRMQEARSRRWGTRAMVCWRMRPRDGAARRCRP